MTGITEAEMVTMGLNFAADHTPDIIETIAGWLSARGVTPDQMHAALTDAAVKRQKALKEAADIASFGLGP